MCCCVCVRVFGGVDHVGVVVSGVDVVVVGGRMVLPISSTGLSGPTKKGTK